jgi:lipopolysaccharide biosynthesis glycosyltransferase
MVIWVKAKEKFHGKDMGTFWKTYKSETEAKVFARQWNSLNSRDHITVLKLSKTKPTGLRPTKYKTIYKEVKGGKVTIPHKTVHRTMVHKSKGGFFGDLKSEMSKWRK